MIIKYTYRVCAFQYDLAYGNKLQRVRREAGEILDEKWRLGEENPFLLPENNLLMDQMTHAAYTKRDNTDIDSANSEGL